jgi:hypothetical protein
MERPAITREQLGTITPLILPELLADQPEGDERAQEGEQGGDEEGQPKSLDELGPFSVSAT